MSFLWWVCVLQLMLLLPTHQAVSGWGLCLRPVCSCFLFPRLWCCATPQQTLLHVRKCLARKSCIEVSQALYGGLRLSCVFCVRSSNRFCMSRLPFVACRCTGVVGGVNACVHGKGAPSVVGWCACVAFGWCRSSVAPPALLGGAVVAVVTPCYIIFGVLCLVI
jgi:hypothetical protein